MSVITEFTVPADGFALADSFEKVPGITVEVERLATHSREWVMPFLWATDGDPEAFRKALQDDSSVEKATMIEQDEGVGLYNVHWHEDVMTLIDMIVDQHGIVIEATATAGVWYLKLRFLDQSRLDEFQTYFDQHDYTFTLLRLYEETEPKQREFNLTPPQREALLAALESGYFEVPRTTKIAELAESLDISSNAASQRLRRATANLVRTTLAVTPQLTDDLAE